MHLAKSFDADSFWLTFDDGRTLGVPLACFPRPLRATPEQREVFEISPGNLHWDAPDEDISVEGLLRGIPGMTRRFHRTAE